MPLTVLQHPVVDHWMTRLRDKRTDPAQFRVICKRLTAFLVMEATRDLPVETDPIETPLEAIEGRALGADIVVVPILRAGLGMLEAVTDILPHVSVGYVGLERDHTTAQARTYYCKLPPVAGSTVLVVDPMLATGGSAEMAVDLLYREGARDVRLLAMVAAPEGVKRLQTKFPELPVFTAALDRQLNALKYIVPGLGDFGDRLYGTGSSAHE
ncbi:uracil phosphoribosyltransferase [Opitutales bacterium ASA1]|uniref:uracil phosphoribosyltransferase n=1 Tax=Congregicoccus parvus TaxID=3081749 RepID=UPI002B2FE872|nr:uracil phosphoribosyltransferase [Opitutales bacterium ASA1]